LVSLADPNRPFGRHVGGEYPGNAQWHRRTAEIPATPGQPRQKRRMSPIFGLSARGSGAWYWAVTIASICN
jgi:hypothetical protein